MSCEHHAPEEGGPDFVQPALGVRVQQQQRDVTGLGVKGQQCQEGVVEAEHDEVDVGVLVTLQRQRQASHWSDVTRGVAHRSLLTLTSPGLLTATHRGLAAQDTGPVVEVVLSVESNHGALGAGQLEVAVL